MIITSIRVAGLAILGLLLFSSEICAQFSLGVQFGYAGSLDNDDAYGLSKAWPAKSGSSGGSGSSSSSDGSMKFMDGGTGTSALATITWEATPHFGVAFIYRSTNFAMPANKRTSACNSFGIQLKINFVKNTNQIVPFFQTEYFFSNSNTLKQTGAVSTSFPTQIMPAFDQTYSTSLGIGGDLGVEIKLSQPFSLVLQGGIHGVQLADSDGDAFAKSLNLGPLYESPSNFDGVFWIQATGGIKYYLGKGKKKRDF